MTTNSRHMACKTCRDRKVRCDGGQPACDKCVRAGDNCIYVPATKHSKADLMEAVENLSERLQATEALLAAAKGYQQPQAPNAAFPDRTSMWTNLQSQLRTPQSTRDDIGYGFPQATAGGMWAQGMQMGGGMLGDDASGMGDLAMNGAGMIFSPMVTSPTAAATTAAASMGTQGLDGMIDGSTSGSFPSPPASALSHHGTPDSASAAAAAMAAAAAGTTAPDLRQAMGVGGGGIAGAGGGPLPSLREVREWSRLGSNASSRNAHSRSKSNGSSDPGDEKFGVTGVFNIYADFVRSTFSTQSDIMGIAAAMADYLLWVRRNNALVNSGTAESAELAGLLDMLETRTREVTEIASQQFDSALDHSRTAFESRADSNRGTKRRCSKDSAVDLQFRTLEKEISNRSADVEGFFRSNYDIHASLGQQRR